MHLSSLTLKDFRAYRTAGLDLPPTGQILVYGANNSGKSSLVSALDLVAGRVPPRLAWRDSPDVAVTATFDLTEQEAMTAVAVMQESEAGFVGGGGFRRFALEFRGPETGAVPVIHRIDAQIRSGQMATIYELVESAPGSPAFYNVMGLTTNARFSDQYAGGLQIRQQSQQLPDPAAMIQELRPLMTLLSQWRTNFFHFSSSRRASSRDIPLQAEPELAPDGENLGKVLTWLNHNEPELWRDLSALMEELVPDLGLLQLPTNGAHTELGFRDEATRTFMNLESLGTGVGQLLMTVALGVMKADSSVLVLEEPETGLHPAAQHALADMLSQWSKDRLIVMTTHSMAFLPDEVSGEGKALLVERFNGESRVRSIDHDSLHEIGEALGVRLLDVLVAERILVVEGPSDVAILQVWFPKIRRTPRVALVIAEGGNGARGAAQFSKWLGQADGDRRRKVLFLRDQDELPADEIERLSSLGVVQILGVREIENYLLLGQGVSAYFSSIGVQVEAAVLDATMREIADSLLPSVVLRAVARAQGLVRLCDDVSRRQLVKAGAGRQEFTAHVLSQIPNKRVLRSAIRAQWLEAESNLRARWDGEWRQIAPGEDVLDGLFRRHLNRGYKKGQDGPALAQHVVAPGELATVLGDFFSSGRG